MISFAARFEEHAARLVDCASLEVSEQDGAVTYRLRPRNTDAAGVVLYIDPWGGGTVAIDDPACGPDEIGEDLDVGLQSIDFFVKVAVDGRATAFHLGRGGCVEVHDGDRTSRTWCTPRMARLAATRQRVDFRPYR